MLGPGSSKSMDSPSPLRRAKTKKKTDIRKSFFAAEFSFFKNVTSEKKNGSFLSVTIIVSICFSENYRKFLHIERYGRSVQYLLSLR